MLERGEASTIWNDDKLGRLELDLIIYYYYWKEEFQIQYKEIPSTICPIDRNLGGFWFYFGSSNY